MAVKIYLGILIALPLSILYAIGYFVWLVMAWDYQIGYVEMLTINFLLPFGKWAINSWPLSVPLGLIIWFLFEQLCTYVGDNIEGYTPVE